MHIERPVEAKRGGDGGDDLGDQPVEVLKITVYKTFLNYTVLN